MIWIFVHNNFLKNSLSKVIRNERWTNFQDEFYSVLEIFEERVKFFQILKALQNIFREEWTKYMEIFQTLKVLENIFREEWKNKKVYGNLPNTKSPTKNFQEEINSCNFKISWNCWKNNTRRGYDIHKISIKEGVKISKWMIKFCYYSHVKCNNFQRCKIIKENFKYE